MSALSLARTNVLALSPYSSARMESGPAPLMLNANESPWPSPGVALELNRYPDPQPAALLERLAHIYDVPAARVLAVRGSDEAIDLLVRAFCRPGIDSIAISPPTFGMYEVCAGIQGAVIESVPLATDDFSLDADAMLAALSSAVRVVFVCSPNNPTGSLVPLATIEHLAGALAGRALVVVDEAYIEFAESDSAAKLLDRYSNLGVLRTLSKAWALAGVRIGTLLAAPELITLLRRIMPPYPLATPCVEIAVAALDVDGERLTGERVATTIAERERLAAALSTLSSVRKVYPSRANFLTVHLHDASHILRGLSAQGIAVRDVGRHPGLRGCLRFTIGTPEENSRLLEALRRIAEAA